jgi:hypothetical protein
MFADLDLDYEVNMASVSNKLTKFRDSTYWNYILMGAALLSLIVAGRNIAVYAKEIKELKKE